MCVCMYVQYVCMQVSRMSSTRLDVEGTMNMDVPWHWVGFSYIASLHLPSLSNYRIGRAFIIVVLQCMSSIVFPLVELGKTLVRDCLGEKD